MKIKKGKIHPSPSSSSSSSDGGDVFNVLKLLPTTILTLASILSLEDKEVLAYMITRSLKTTTSAATAGNPQIPAQDSKKKPAKKSPNSKPTSKNPIFANPTKKIPISPNLNHKVPIFDCDCFDCYTSYWFRWDSSDNRELIHQAIEAFEDHLTSGEQSKKQQKGNKRRDYSNNSSNNTSGGRIGEKSVLDSPEGAPEMEGSVIISPEINGVLPEIVGGDDDKGEEKGEILGVEIVPMVEAAEETEDAAAVVRSPAAGVSNHKGLARKVLPDVLGILNSRLWSLWGPNV